MNKQDFVTVFELVLLAADLDITRLSLADENTVMIEFKGGGKRLVDITADSNAAIILENMKHVF